jgi:hypothetical protein
MKTARLFDTRSSWPRKAQSALLRCSLAPQPRSTATALSMPLGGNHSGTQSNSSGRSRHELMPNPSLKLTRYGMRCKPGPRHMVHHRSPGLQRMPPRAA